MRTVVLVALLALSLPGVDAAGGALAGPGYSIFAYDGGDVPVMITITAEFIDRGVAGVEYRSAEFVRRARGIMYGADTEVAANGATIQLARDSTDVVLSTSIPGGESGILVVWGAGGVERITFSIDPPGVADLTFRSSTTANTFIDGNSALEGAHAHAAALGVTASASAATHEFDVAHTFLGFAGARWSTDHNTLSDSITLTQPDGATQGCYCHAPATLGPDWRPGHYEIAWIGASADIAEPILLAGVDVPGLPRQPWDT